MSKNQTYSSDDVCKALNITMYTLSNWYRWEKKQLAQGLITETYLPQPIRLEHTKGTPRRWTAKMVKELEKYQHSIVTGRNGIYGVYSNPNHKDTKKYKKSIDNVEQK